MRRRAGLLLAAALAAASCGGAAPATTTAAGVPSIPDDDVHYRWEAGDCITVPGRDALPHAPYGRSAVVDCAEPHAFEVFFTGDLPEGPDDAYPSDLRDRVRESCAAAFRDYVGAHLSETALDMVTYLPDRTEWGEGLRYLGCLLEDPRAGGDVSPVTGSLRDAAGAVAATAAAGECFAGPAIRGPAADCGAPHVTEMIGVFTHPEEPGAAWPGTAEVSFATTVGCGTLLEEYATAGAGTVPADPVAFARPLSRAEWEDGLRSVRCAALVFDGDRHHVTVVGSLSDPGWWVIGAGQAA